MNEAGEHDFSERLEWSHRMHELPIWVEAYQSAFPGCTICPPHSANGDHQKQGIDRTLVLSNGKSLWTDEKAREPLKGKPWYQPIDVLLEYESNDRTHAPGWAVKALLADYIAYAILQTGHCFLLPVIQLQQAWLRNREEWLKKYKTKRARNRGYDTLSCAVPVDVLFPAIGSCLRVRGTPMSWEQLDLFMRSPEAA